MIPRMLLISLIPLLLQLSLKPSGVASHPQDSGITGFVKGGTDAELTDHPWIGFLRVESPLPGSQESQQCGCSSLSSRVLITAAHCVLFQGVTARPEDTLVTLGLKNIAKINTSPTVTFVEIARVIVHPDYNDRVVYDNDLALLITKQRIAFIPNIIQPISLPDDFFQYEANFAEVAGWGYTNEDQNIPDHLQKGKVFLLTRQICQDKIESIGREMHENMICAGSRTIKACKGDSGGPLVTNIRNQTNYELVGVLSWNKGGSVCAPKSFPTVYMKIPEFLGWINLNLKIYSDTAPVYGTEPGKDCWYGKVCSTTNPDVILQESNIDSLEPTLDCFNMCRKYDNYGQRCEHFTLSSNPLYGTICTLLSECFEPYSTGNPEETSGPGDCTRIAQCPKLTYGIEDARAGKPVMECRWLDGYYANKVPHMHECFSIPDQKEFTQCWNGTWIPIPKPDDWD